MVLPHRIRIGQIIIPKNSNGLPKTCVFIHDGQLKVIAESLMNAGLITIVGYETGNDF